MALAAERPIAGWEHAGEACDLKWVGMLVPETELTRNRDNQISPTAIEDLLKMLAAEGLHSEEFAREFGPPH